MKRKILAGILGTVLMGTAVLSGCGGGGTSDSENGGELVLYTWEAMFPQEVLDAFEKRRELRLSTRILIQMRRCWRSYPRQKAGIMM